MRLYYNDHLVIALSPTSCPYIFRFHYPSFWFFPCRNSQLLALILTSTHNLIILKSNSLPVHSQPNEPGEKQATMLSLGNWHQVTLKTTQRSHAFPFATGVPLYVNTLLTPSPHNPDAHFSLSLDYLFHWRNRNKWKGTSQHSHYLPAYLHLFAHTLPSIL